MLTAVNLFRITLLSLVVFGAVASVPVVSRGAILYTGTNLSGAEFGQGSLPGTYGTHYIYPYTSEVDYFVDKGMNTFRLPIRWERLQTSQNAALNTAELTRLNNFINYVTKTKGAYVILEPHNFARYYPMPASAFQTSTIGLVGSSVPNSSFADFWGKVANQYKTNSHVIFNLMNEPANMDTDQWVGAANAAIAAIRATGATNIIHVPGNRYTGTWTWNTSGSSSGTGRSNAQAMLDIVDPGNNIVFEVHQYLDSNGSGTSTGIAGDNVNTGVTRLTDFTNWLHANNRRGFLGEFAVANSRIGPNNTANPPQIGDETLVNMLNYIQANSDVWEGWAWWSAGPWWDGGPDPSKANLTPYLFLLDPANLGLPTETDKAAMAVLQPYFATMPGDWNHDDAVNASDVPAMLAALANVQQYKTDNNLNAAQFQVLGDLNGDFLVNNVDLQAMLYIVKNGGSGAVGVPEPNAVLLFFVGSVGLGLARYRRFL